MNKLLIAVLFFSGCFYKDPCIIYNSRGTAYKYDNKLDEIQKATFFESLIHQRCNR